MKNLAIFVITLVVTFVVCLGVFSLVDLSIKLNNPSQQRIIIEIKGDGIQMENPPVPAEPEGSPNSGELFI